MPRGPKGERRAADVIGNAVHIMRIGVFTRLGQTRSFRDVRCATALPPQSRNLPTGVGSSPSSCLKIRDGIFHPEHYECGPQITKAALKLTLYRVMCSIVMSRALVVWVNIGSFLLDVGLAILFDSKIGRCKLGRVRLLRTSHI